MSRSVWDKGNQIFCFSHCLQQYFGNLQITILVVASDIVDASLFSPSEHLPDSIAVILDIEPISDIGPISIEWYFFIFLDFCDKKWNQGYAILVGSIVVRTTSDRVVESEGATIRLHQDIASRLGR